MNKRKYKYIALTVLTLIITLFIFGNSFSGFDASHHTSESVSEMILPNKYASSEKVLLIIRKSAHLVEYAALGAAVWMLFNSIARDYGKSFFGTSLFYTLAVAVADEHIQSYSDRTSSTGDIILDFCGAVIGFFVGWLVIKIYTYIKRRIKKTDKAGGQS